MTARWITADVFDGLATLEDGSVDLVVTSPPFGWLRSYLPADHPDKPKEIGHEENPAAFIDVLLRVTAELRRVLVPHGSIAVELGDTYSGSGQGPDERTYGPGALNGGRRNPGEGWPLAKSKTLIPELYRLALAYGINPLTGQPSPAGRWRVRNVVTWCRPNPPVGALGDKWRPATSDIVIACTSDKRYWDDIATRRPHKSDPEQYSGNGYSKGFPEGIPGNESMSGNSAGAPLLDYWEIPPGGYPGSHYAVYPPALVEPLVKAMAPPKVCETCGEPSRRITESVVLVDGKPVDDPTLYGTRFGGARIDDGANRTATHKAGKSLTGIDNNRVTSSAITKGWSDCGHDDWRPAHILDPFAGSGTTLAVATGHGHNATGIDLDERNRDLAYQRIGPFLFEQVDASSAP